MPRVFLETYGCQMNVADSELVTGVLGDAGWTAVATPGEADVILVNTCAVREHAAERVLRRLSDLRCHKRRRKDVLVGVIGCLARHAAERIVDAAPWIDLLAGPDVYRRLPELVAAAGPADTLIDVRPDRREVYDGLSRTPAPGVSGLLSVQRGCDRFCTFCVVPYVRGRERAVAPEEVERQVAGLAASGVSEVTLLGQTVNSYRHGDVTFAGLLRRVAAVEGISRVRFTSPHPVGFDGELVRTLGEVPEVMPHVHLPVQSGSDAVLERMGRGHTAADYLRLVDDLRAAVPGIGLTTDVIVGFPGETDADYEATLDLLRRVRFASAFMFRYSEREGTVAARRLPDDVPDVVKGVRLDELIVDQEAISREVCAALVGRTVEVLLASASKRSPDDLAGRARDFKTVVVRGAEATSHSLIGRPA